MSASPETGSAWSELKQRLPLPDNDLDNLEKWIKNEWETNLRALSDLKSAEGRVQLGKSSKDLATKIYNISALISTAISKEDLEDILRLGPVQQAPVTLETVVVRVQLKVTQIGQEKEFAEFSLSRCLQDGKLATLPKNYDHKLFLREAETHINEARAVPLEFAHGTLTYSQWNNVKQIARQTHFEVAISHLFNNRGDDDTILFTFQPESEAQERNRLNAERASQRLKAPAPGSGTKRRLTESPKATQPQSTRTRVGPSKESTPPPRRQSPVYPSDDKVTPTGQSKRIPGGPGSMTAKAGPTSTPSLHGSVSSRSSNPSKVPRTSSSPSGGPKTVAPKAVIESPASKPIDKPVTAQPQKTTIAAKSTPPLSFNATGKKIGGLIKRATSRAGNSSVPTTPTESRGERVGSEATINPPLRTYSAQPQDSSLVRPSTATKVGENLKHALGSLRQTLVPNNLSASTTPLDKDELRRGDEQIPELRTSKPATGDDADEEVEEEHQFIDEEDQADFSVSQLQNLQNMDELIQMTTPTDPFERWQACCRLFRIDSTKTGINERVPVAGLKHPLYQYQAFGVYWQMAYSRENGGGFLADEMGLGKTLSYLAFIVVERQLSVLWREVLESRQADDGRHLHKAQHREGDICPSQRDHWIACPCTSSSPASSWPAKYGLRMACVPPSMVQSWKDQFIDHIAPLPALDMKLIIAHKATSNLDSFDVNTVHNTNLMKAVQNPLPSQRVRYDEDEAAINQDRILVLTTSESTQKASKPWQERFQHKVQMRVYDKSEAGRWYEFKAPGLVYGIAMIDECHEHYHKEKGRSGVLANLPQENHPFLWGYSGTPFTQTPRGLEGVLWAIEKLWPKDPKFDPKRTAWEQNLHTTDQRQLHRFTWKKLDAICKSFERHLKDTKPEKTTLDEIFQRFKPFLTTFMIRRNADTLWFGHPLLKLNPHEHTDITLEHNLKYDDDIAQLRTVIQAEIAKKVEELQSTWDNADPRKRDPKRPTKLSFNSACSVQWRLRIMATFPALVPYAAKEHPEYLELTAKECFKFRRSGLMQSPYKHFREICEASPKCMELYRIIDDMCNSADYEGKEHKLVIMSEFNPVVLLLQLFIQHLVTGKKNRVGVVTADMKLKDRTAVIEAFTDAMDDKGERKHKDNFQFLIGTTRLIGTGLQLTRAAAVVMMEPQYEFFREVQGYARVHRIGQRNPKSFSYRLIDEGSEVETSILKRQADRNEFAGKATDGDGAGLEQMDVKSTAESQRDISMTGLSGSEVSDESRISDQMSGVNLGATTSVWNDDDYSK
ncbi:uncharacterized protein LY89DRAFT_781683 [Mollisia scopiformis]|uniref:Uncharacterized protein n=1 Tax=Mollisia scopiformis TaxID=149040 RepID=A0A194XBD6_MOLSC|nr:uncharacterized protein LY89DRAFT_781683 [Mollisia scopiformis]KUJ17485.1 hypothetical protein LY89DRAFT_781683 [Mollisia scopiformis]